MIRLLSITVEGYGSIGGPQNIRLDVGGTVLIKAPVGTGKTSLFSALVWTLYGKNIKGKSSVNTWKKYQTKEYKGTRGHVYFETQNGLHEVIRCQNYTGKLEDGAKGGDRVLLIKNGETINLKGKVNIQQAINEALGCSYELFISSIMFGQGMKRLIQEDNSDKKKIFEEIFQLGYLNVARDIAMEGKNKLLTSYNEVDAQYRETKKELELTQVTYKEVLDREENYQSLLKRNQREIQERLDRFKKQIQANKDKLEDEDYGGLYQATKYGISELEDELEKAEQVKDKSLIDVVQDTINLLEAKKVKQATNSLKQILSAFKEAEKLRKEIKYHTKKLSEYRDKYKEQQRIEENIKFIKAEIKELKAQAQEKKTEKLTITSHKYLDKIKKLQLSIRKLTKSKEALEKQLDDYTWVLSDPLSNNGIKTYLFDTSLQTLNNILYRYSEILGFRVEFNVDLDSASKKFVTLIEKDGVIADYSELSGGEKGLVNITMCLALHETLTDSQDVNLLLLDEVFENLDSDCIELVISLIRTLSDTKSVFLISHLENLPFPNCKSLEVTKNNGLTHYSQL